MKTRIGMLIGIFLLLTNVSVGAGAIGVTLNPPSPTTGNTLTATVLNNGTPVPGILVSFSTGGGVPIFNMTNSQGIAIYKPLIAGNLVVKATLDGVLLASTSTVVNVPTVPQPPSPGNGGGSGGGGGGISGEAFANILMKESHDEDIFVNLTTTYKFKDERNPITYVAITGNVNAGSTTTTVEVLKNTSSFAKEKTPGIVYKNVNIWAGTSGFSTTRNVKGINIGFRVLNSWLTDKNIASSDIKMIKWNGTNWVSQTTKEKSKDGNYTYFETNERTLSPHAIIADKKGTPGLSEPEPPEQELPKPTSVVGETSVKTTEIPTSKTPGFEFITGIVVVFGLYVYLRIRK